MMMEDNIVDQARAIIVHVLDGAAIKYGPGDPSYEYLAGMARKVKAAEAAHIDSYLVLDCVIAALKFAPQSPAAGEGEER
jgi:hypothetical protein